MEKNLQLPLKQMSGSYNYQMCIPLHVEEKIKYLCHKISNIEWSGILFFKYEGNFTNNDLKIICQDIFIMDIGNSVNTEFKITPEVISYMTDNELLDCQMGLIHSHHCMGTSFSHTDINTLYEEGKERNNFVSLIVNNAGNYTAAITRKIKVSTKVLSSSLFDKEELNNKQPTNKDIIAYVYLNIEKEKSDNSILKSIDDRINELNKNKVREQKITKIEDKQLQFPYYKEQEFNKSSKNLDIDITADSDIVKSIIIKLLTSCTIVQPENEVNIEKWITSMQSIYDKNFNTLEDFEYWAETFIEYLIWSIEDYILSKEGYDSTEISAIYAHNVIQELNKYNNNMYIDTYINILKRYTEI